MMRQHPLNGYLFISEEVILVYYRLLKQFDDSYAWRLALESNFLLYEETANAPQIIDIGHITNRPTPNVETPTMIDKIVIMIAPHTVEYNIPSDPNITVRIIAIPTLLVGMTTRG